MRILHLVSGNDIGGAKTHLLTLIAELNKTIYAKLLCLSTGPTYRDAIKNHLPALSLDQRKRSDLSVVDKIVKLLRDERIDILHCHGARANFVASFIKRKTKIITVSTIHSNIKRDFEHSAYKKLFYTFINSRSLKGFDYYFTVSQAFKEEFEEAGFDASKMRVIYNGISTESTMFLEKKKNYEALDVKVVRDKIDGKIVIGSATRMHPVKGIEVILKAAEILKSKSYDFIVKLAGTGPFIEKYREKINKMNLNKHVVIMGHVDDMPIFYNSLDVNVLSSYSESWPYAIMEGGLFSLPTVASRVGGVPEMIRDGIDGILFDSGDYKALANALEKFIKDYKLRNKFGKNLHDRIIENFTAKNMAKDHISLYNEILWQNPKNIAICGYYGFQNSGDDAILSSILLATEEIRRPVKMTILSNKPEKTSSEYGYDSINRFSFKEVNKLFSNIDVLLLGGGSLLQDRTSNRSLYYYLGIMRFAKFKKLRVMLYANGIGPIKSKFNRHLSKKTLNKIDLITIREEFSERLIREIGVKTPVVEVTADPVFNLFKKKNLSSESKILSRIPELHEGSQIVGVMFRKWEHEEKFTEKMAKICDAIIEFYNFKIVFLPMKHPSDISVAEKISLKMKHSSIVLKDKYSPEDIITFISKMKIVLGMRLHSIIYSSLASVPFIAFKYDPKLAYYAQKLGMPLIENLANIDTDDVLEHFDNIIKKRRQYQDLLKERVKLQQNLADKNIKFLEMLI